MLWSAQGYIFSATFSRSDVRRESVDGQIRVLLDKYDKERQARML